MTSTGMFGGSVKVVLLLGLLLGAAPVIAADMQVTRAKLFFKIATYDANLPAGGLKIGVVSTKESGDASKLVQAAFESLADLKVGGRAFSSELLAPKRASDLAGLVRDRGFYGLYVPNGTPDEWVGAVVTLAKQQGLFTFTEDVGKVALGIVASVEEADSKRVIVLNANAALEAGRKFDSAFLEVCKIIR